MRIVISIEARIRAKKKGDFHMKKLIPLALVLVTVFTVAASAASVAPRWAAMDSCSANLSFSGSTAYASTYVYAPGAEITAVMKLQKQNLWGSYGTVQTWTLTATDYMMEERSYTPVSSGTYKVVSEITAVSSGGTDTATVYKVLEN